MLEIIYFVIYLYNLEHNKTYILILLDIIFFTLQVISIPIKEHFL